MCVHLSPCARYAVKKKRAPRSKSAGEIGEEPSSPIAATGPATAGTATAAAATAPTGGTVSAPSTVGPVSGKPPAKRKQMFIGEGPEKGAKKQKKGKGSVTPGALSQGESGELMLPLDPSVVGMTSLSGLQQQPQPLTISGADPTVSGAVSDGAPATTTGTSAGGAKKVRKATTTGPSPRAPSSSKPKKQAAMATLTAAGSAELPSSFKLGGAVAGAFDDEGASLLDEQARPKFLDPDAGLLPGEHSGCWKSLT